MEGGVYLLCAMTAFACSALLFRGFRRSRTRLLFWCGLFFAAMALDNALLFIDITVVPNIDLTMLRRIVPLSGVAVLLFGLIWDVK